MTGRVAGKVAFITGAARGQGRSHAVRLAEEGADIIAIDICGPVSEEYNALGTPEDLEQTVAEVEKRDRRILARQVDVRDLAGVEQVVRDGIAELGRLDIVIANAAIGSVGRSWEIPPERWRDVIDVDLTGAWHTARAAIPHLIEAGHGGSIIFIGSVASLKGHRNVAGYVAAKHGLVGLMRTMANELGEYYIRVNTIHPTNVDTPMIQNPRVWGLFTPPGEQPSVEYAISGMTARHSIPVPWVDPADISNAVIYLGSDESRYITGVSLPVDAGLVIK